MNGKCDFCYVPQIDADLQIMARNGRMGSQFEICESCWLLIRNVISVVLHKVSHKDFVMALEQKMNDLGLDYKDLMVSIWANPLPVQGSTDVSGTKEIGS